MVREHIPLEQGLRLSRDVKGDVTKGQRAYSIRTRIKTICRAFQPVVADSVREHIPLEQGLRH